jgi:hypothetical protein
MRINWRKRAFRQLVPCEKRRPEKPAGLTRMIWWQMQARARVALAIIAVLIEYL